MRLLNTTSFKLEYFAGGGIPKYAILSHKWEAEEILFEDLQTIDWTQKKGADKVKSACLRASKDGFEYIWIDTCCIDKSSSAELSEAINSMFNWYHHSQLCYVYLFDVPAKSFVQSVWFTRGWTLQELIAPERVQFFDSQWRRIGDRLSLLEDIAKVTAIDRQALGRGQHHRHCSVQATRPGYSRCCRCRGGNDSQAFRQLLSSFSVATRLSWASRRVTTRVEDQAYALLGLFNVNMPLLYGEGTKAFRRLQEEIIRNSNDQSILAGQHQLDFVIDIYPDNGLDHLFASRPCVFQRAAYLERSSTSSKYLPMTLTNRCLNMDLHMGWLGILACVYSDDYLSRPAILLDRLSYAGNDRHVFRRTQSVPYTLIRMSPDALLDRDGEVQINEEELVVGLDPSRIKMMNIDLLIHFPMETERTRTPAIRIDPTIGGHDDMGYRIRTSLPELEEAPNGHVRDPAFMIRKPEEVGPSEWGGDVSGLLAIDDGSSHGFFVAYGITVHYDADIDGLDYAARSEFYPWCQLLEWDQVVLDGVFTPDDDKLADILDGMIFFIYDRADVLEPVQQVQEVQLRDSMSWTGLGIRAQVAMTPNTFLDQTMYELEIAVWRIDGSSETHGGPGSNERP
ncbi:hypothetical protein N0V84_011095 [Fusarium piperis]|uniref:Heterokaryon incompatibility domain-containing protein n=1 Tax=Fusarium piperis TaxID=1435070 RepID=A0A9W8W3A7_9HYPO|nr:hypothetical protein N0V84_011095 [Fusarium piperis]